MTLDIEQVRLSGMLLLKASGNFPYVAYPKLILLDNYVTSDVLSNLYGLFFSTNYLRHCLCLSIRRSIFIYLPCLYFLYNTSFSNYSVAFLLEVHSNFVPVFSILVTISFLIRIKNKTRY